MKKIISVLLSVIMAFSICNIAFADYASENFSFDKDGNFKIMQVNDTQDIDRMNKNTVNFLKAALEKEQPDLVVVAGDILSSMFFGATPDRIRKAIRSLGSIFNDAKIPFAVTFGNHDHDLEDILSIADMMETFKEFEYCVSGEGCDPGTYNIPVMSSDGSKIALNIYMMDSNNKDEETGGYAGVNPQQVQWYKQKSDELKAANGGEVVKSLLFQHVPVKEIYQFCKEVPFTEANRAVFSTNDFKWYVLNEDYIIDKENAIFGEAPCSEKAERITGQYEAWLEKGDIIGAFFAHDHINNFVGKTDEGIILGYNGGTGFRAYGSGDKRSVRIFEINENDVASYTTRPVFYADIVGSLDYYPSDIFGTALLGDILRILLRLVGIIEWK